MNKDEEIIIKVEKGKMKKLKELGFSAQDVFSKGLYELLREKYGEYLTSDDDFDEFTEDDDFTEFMRPKNKFVEIIVPDCDIDNN